MRGPNPAPLPGDQAHPNPGQTDPEEHDIVLDSDQDVQQPGYYFNAIDGQVRYFQRGDTTPSGDGVWYYLTSEPDVTMDHLRDIAETYGFDLEPNDLHLP